MSCPPPDGIFRSATTRRGRNTQFAKRSKRHGAHPPSISTQPKGAASNPGRRELLHNSITPGVSLQRDRGSWAGVESLTHDSQNPRMQMRPVANRVN